MSSKRAFVVASQKAPPNRYGRKGLRGGAALIPEGTEPEKLIERGVDLCERMECNSMIFTDGIQVCLYTFTGRRGRLTT
jgi:hypothetical protein